MIDIEFWPDYDRGPLWVDGREVPPESLDLPASLADRVRVWNAQYDDAKLPVGGPGDPTWLAEGRNLLREVGEALGPEYEIGANEDWWTSD